MPGRILLVLILVFPTISAMPAIPRPEDRRKPSGPIRVIDFRGRPVVLSRPARRVVCLIESALSGLYMLNAESSVVGVPAAVYHESAAPQYAVLDQRIRDRRLPAPGNWDFVNLESVIALRPDLAILWARQTETINALEQRGIPVYGVQLDGFNDVVREMEDIGDLTGTRKRADSLVAYTKIEVERVAKSVSDLQKTRAYFMWAQGPLETSGVKSTVNELLILAGAENVVPSVREHLIINLENLILWNPEVIVMWANPSMAPVDVMAMPAWRSVPAVREHRVYELPPVFFCDLWTLKYQQAVKMTAAWCHPRQFPGLDLDRENRKMMAVLYGKKGKLLQ